MLLMLLMLLMLKRGDSNEVLSYPELSGESGESWFIPLAEKPAEERCHISGPSGSIVRSILLPLCNGSRPEISASGSSHRGRWMAGRRSLPPAQNYSGQAVAQHVRPGARHVHEGVNRKNQRHSLQRQAEGG
jgi:hypothetical protein